MAGVSYTIGNMLIKGIPFITLPIFTSIMSTEDFGIYNIYLSYESVISIIFGLGLAGTVRIAKVEYKMSFEEYISSIYILQVFANLVLDILFFLVIDMIQLDAWMSNKFKVILLLNALCTQIYNTACSKYAILGDVKNNLILSGVLTIINVFSSLLLCQYIYENDAYAGRIIGTFLGAIVVAVLVLVHQFTLCHKGLSIKYWHFGVKMGMPLIIHALSLTILAQCDKIMIQNMVGYDAAGIYSLAATLLGVVVVIVGAFDNAWAPWYFDNLIKNNLDYIRKNNNILITLFCFLCALLMLISPELISIMSDKQYWDAGYVFSPLLVSVYFNFLYLFPVNYEYFSKKTGYIAYSTVITAILNIGLNYVFIIKFNYYGAAYATAISKVVLFFMHKKKAESLGGKNLMSSKLLLLSAFSLSLLSAATVVLKDLCLARMAIFACVMILLYRYIRQNGLYKSILK